MSTPAPSKSKNKKGFVTTQVYTIEKSLRHHVIEWVATTMSITGAILNAQLNIWGFYLFSVANFFWISFAIKHKHWGLLITNILFFIFNVYGIIVWQAKL